VALFPEGIFRTLIAKGEDQSDVRSGKKLDICARI
jgi:hypothetical protein